MSINDLNNVPEKTVFDERQKILQLRFGIEAFTIFGFCGFYMLCDIGLRLQVGGEHGVRGSADRGFEPALVSDTLCRQRLYGGGKRKARSKNRLHFGSSRLGAAIYTVLF